MAENVETRTRRIERSISKAYARHGADPDVPIEAWEELLPCRDGTRLRTLFFRPANAASALPTVVQRSCYPHMERMLRAHAKGYCGCGFAFILQWCRGTGGSEGEWVPNEHERDDGQDFLSALEALPWVGSVGLWGSSYSALAGWAVADIAPSKVATMYLSHYGTDRFLSAYQDGLFRHDVLTGWAMQNAGFPVEADYLASCRYRPHSRVDEALWGRALPWYRDWVTHASQSDAYWGQGFWGTLAEVPGKVRFPVYIGEGWYDHQLGSALRTWVRLSDASKAHSTLRVGCWNHAFQPCLQERRCERLENSDTETALGWFDRILKRGETPAPRISTYQIGEDHWIEHAAYPFAADDIRRLYLADSGRIDSAPPAHGSVSFRYDPEDPAPSHGAESMLTTGAEQGSLRQQQPNSRPDIVSFVSEPLDDLRIVGRIRVMLTVSSDAEDTAFTAKVIEVLPDGRAYNIRSGITTLGFRGHSAARQTYAPGERVEAPIDLWDIAYTLPRGARIRVDISSSDFPQYAVHSNTPGVWSEQTDLRPTMQTIYLDGGASYVELPLMR